MRWVLEEFKLWSDNRVTGVFTADPEGNMIDMEQNPSYSCRGVPFWKAQMSTSRRSRKSCGIVRGIRMLHRGTRATTIHQSKDNWQIFSYSVNHLNGRKKQWEVILGSWKLWWPLMSCKLLNFEVLALTEKSWGKPKLGRFILWGPLMFISIAD